jgi:hypothetical protein
MKVKRLRLPTMVLGTLALLSNPGHGQTMTSTQPIPSGDPGAVSSVPVKQRTPDQSEAIRAYRIHVSDEALRDLKRRINETRWPDKETVADRSQGAQLANLQELLKYWGTKYDWRRVESRLNSYPNYVTNIDSVDVQFSHVVKERCAAADHHPRLAGLRHRAARVIDPLTDPTAHGGTAADADVVIPSIPGYGFRQAGRCRLGSGAHRAGVGSAGCTGSATLATLHRAVIGAT